MRGASARQQYVGLDVHKNSIQVAVMDQDGKVLRNTKIDNTDEDVRRTFARISRSARCVMESSSVWYGLFRFVSDELDRDVILSNPFETRAIAVSKKKTDRVDAQILADLLRGGYISACHVPSKPTVRHRQMTRSRAKAGQRQDRAEEPDTRHPAAEQDQDTRPAVLEGMDGRGDPAGRLRDG